MYDPLSSKRTPAGLAAGEFLKPEDQRDLRDWAASTWHSMEALSYTGGLPADHLRQDGGKARYTSPTNMAASIWSIIAAQELGLINPKEASKQLGRTLKTLSRIERHPASGAFYNWYDPRTTHKLTRWPASGARLPGFLSVVDNAWLAVALRIVQNALPSLSSQAAELYDSLDFSFFFDPEVGLLRGGFWPSPPPGIPHFDGFTDFYYGTLNTETRIASYLAIARGQVPPDHYFRMQRTPPPDSPLPQRSYPGGMWRRYLGVDVFEGHYQYAGVKVVPSWGGSMFEALMPALFIPEEQLGQGSWGRNHPNYVYTHIAHGLQEAGYGFWGFSPACVPESGAHQNGDHKHPRYREYGLDAVAIFPKGYTSNEDGLRSNPEFDSQSSPEASQESFTNGVVSPYASFLALDFSAMAALHNLRSMINYYDIYGPWGFWDSLNITTGRRAGFVLALDQGLIMAAICNILCDDILQDYFTTGEIEAALRPLLAIEEFTTDVD
jgi:hypothetical protein